MTLWWIGNIVLIAVVLPVVVVILNRVLSSVREIGKRADDLTAVGASIETNLDSVPDLVRSQYQVRQTRRGLERYGAALDEIL